ANVLRGLVAAWVFLGEPFRDRTELCTGLLERDTGFESGKCKGPVRFSSRWSLDRNAHRQDDLGWIAQRESESPLNNSHYLAFDSVDSDAPTDDVGIGPEPVFPELISYHQHRRRAVPRVLNLKAAAHDGLASDSFQQARSCQERSCPERISHP